MDQRMNIEYLKSLSFQERKAVKAQVLAEQNAKSEKARKRNARNANRRNRYFVTTIADKECVCGSCGLTKTYKEMAIANKRSPKHEDNLCNDCLDYETKIDEALEKLEEMYNE